MRWLSLQKRNKAKIVVSEKRKSDAREGVRGRARSESSQLMSYFWFGLLITQ